jgi:anti-sigma regulatory factor (Ser/Thr protein kinase)
MGGSSVAKVRVYEIAKELGVDTKRMLARLSQMGSPARSASSTIDPDIVRRLRSEAFLYARSGPTERSLSEPFEVSSSIEMSSTALQAVAVPKSLVVDVSALAVGNEPPPIASIPPRVVPLGSMAGRRDVDAVLSACRSEFASGASRPLLFDLAEANGFYPNAAVPFAAILAHYRTRGLDVRLTGVSAAALAMRVNDPLPATPVNIDTEPSLSRVWTYTGHREADLLTKALVSAIRHKMECTDGVLEALEWCLYEVFDNVTQHSGEVFGYAMVQHHAQSKRLAVCVADTGVGVQRSLASSVQYRPKSAFDALTLAIREGVTRDAVSNQGNGLFGLFRIVEQNKGKLAIRSGRGVMSIEGDRITGDSSQIVIGPDNHGTTIDFQLAADRPVRIGEALNYTHVNDFLEGLENPDGEHVIVLREQAGGAGSRAAARELRTLIVNVLNEGAPYVVLDFTGQSVVSSSFADEVIGKLVVQMGFVTFSHRVRLVSMSPTIETLLNRSISLRVAQA